jgi:hypothetical protein
MTYPGAPLGGLPGALEVVLVDVQLLDRAHLERRYLVPALQVTETKPKGLVVDNQYYLFFT